MLRNMLMAVSVFGVIGPVEAQTTPKDEPKALVVKVYDLKPVFGTKTNNDADVGFGDLDAVIKVIFDAIPGLRELKPGANGPQVIERDGEKLEVHAPAEVHSELTDLISAKKRLVDVAVDVKAEVVELDVVAFEKLQKALPKAGRGKVGSPVLFATGEDIEKMDPKGTEKLLAEANKVLKAGRLVQTSSGRFVNGAKAIVSSRRTLVTFSNVTNAVRDGFSLAAVPVVSADRRFARFKLTEQSTAITGIKKRELGDIGGKPIIVQTPLVDDLGSTASAMVADGGTLLFRLSYAPKDMVWVVVLKPTIFIQAEEDELKEQQKK